MPRDGRGKRCKEKALRPPPGKGPSGAREAPRRSSPVPGLGLSRVQGWCRGRQGHPSGRLRGVGGRALWGDGRVGGGAQGSP